MRKGMLFFSQYRTLRRIFLKNLKKYLRFVGPYRPGAFFCRTESFGLRFGPCFAATNADRDRAASAASGPADRCRRRFRRAECATDAAEYGPEVSNAHLAFGSRRSFAGTGVCCFTGAGVCCGPLLVCRDGCTLFCPTGPSLFCGVDARRFAGANAHCFVGPGALTGIFRTFVPEAVPCSGAAPAKMHPAKMHPAECPQRCVPGMMPLRPCLNALRPRTRSGRKRRP